MSPEPRRLIATCLLRWPYACLVSPCLLLVRAASFFTKPYNSPAHQNIPFSAFLRKQWALNPNKRPPGTVYSAHYRDGAGHEKGRLHRVAHDQGTNGPPGNMYPAGGSCGTKNKQTNLKWCRGLPGKWCGHIPVYETPSGVAFEGILQMRGWKLRNFLKVKSWAAPSRVEVVTYDELMLSNDAPAIWLERLSQRHPTLDRRAVSGKQLVRGFDLVQGTYKNEKKSFDAAAHSRAQMYQRRCVKRPWTVEDLRYANRVIDWEAEAQAGFSRIPDDAALCAD